MLSATVPAKRKPSCGTMPSCRRSDSWWTERKSTSSIVIAPSVGAAERARRAGRNVEVEAVQALGARPVGEVHVVEANVAPHVRELRGGFGVLDVGPLDEHLHDLVECGHRREEGAVELRQLLHR